ncbi:MAG: peptidylprolyl isomerase [Deltaproteobacteria bacterium]|nr:peptidylprolyl isomerase [Deltaproteobacteria bacterium]MBW1923347.1 peptidylprolyl isomerase [Deltaproteobacteria bacterium]MBW1949579.1 peptidylprolyl isomerase [Deltaproteobacteria bacterium]MBW2009136.1 peptidylprolyl isomerase [Deltaproteobacteria bacterium]MBW2348232.1 peptidylprolyl isomerase [Deltaproteobacteria bacterium]
MIDKKSLWVLFILALVLVWSPSSSPAELRNRVVAVVNDDLITLHELNEKIRQVTGMAPEALRRRDEKGFLQTRARIIDLLINEKIAEEKIRELAIKVKDEEVDAAIERIKENYRLTHEDLLAKLKESGLTFEAYRDKIRKELERVRLINREVKSKIVLREEEIRAYYKEHKSSFEEPRKVRLASIFFKCRDPQDDRALNALREKAMAVHDRIEQGADFAEMARRFSQGPGAAEGGDLGSFKVAQLDPVLREIAQRLSPGQISEPVRRPFGFQILKVLEKTGGALRPFPEVRNAIYDILYRREVDKRYSDWIKELREKAYTKIVF